MLFARFNRLLLTLLLLPSIAYAQGGGEEEIVASVNGVDITAREYQAALIDRLQTTGRSPEDVASLTQIERDAALLRLIDNELLMQRAEAYGVDVSFEEARQMMLNDPPGFMRDLFTTEGGRYNAAALRDVVGNPERIANYITAPGVAPEQIVESWRRDVDQVVRYVQLSSTRDRLLDTLTKQDPISESEIRYRFYAENSVIDGDFIRVLHSTLPDSAFYVSDAEAREWYRTHREDYAAPPSRLISGTIFQVDPTPADSLRQAERIEALKDRIAGAPRGQRLTVVEDLIEELPANRIPVGQLVPPSNFPPPVARALLNAELGSLVGPFPIGGESLLLYVHDSRESRDTLLRARHILLRYPEGDRVADSAMEALAHELKENIDSEEDFILGAQNYSQDRVSGEQAGDLGYVARGQLVPEVERALFAGDTGHVIGPVKTDYGYHLLWLTDRSTRSFELRELRIPLQPGPDVVERASGLVQMYVDAIGTDRAQGILTEYRNAIGPIVRDTSWIKRLEPYGDVLITGEFAFRNAPGAVGVFDVPENRIAVIEVLDRWEGGAPPYEQIPHYPEAHVRRQKQLDSLESRMHAIVDSIDVEMLIGPLRELAPMAEIFVFREEQVSTPPDEEETILDSLITVTPRRSVSGPVRGTHGYYFLRVFKKFAPTEAEWRAQQDIFTRNYLQRHRAELFDELIGKSREEAEIYDLRPETLEQLGREGS